MEKQRPHTCSFEQIMRCLKQNALLKRINFIFVLWIATFSVAVSGNDIVKFSGNKLFSLKSGQRIEAKVSQKVHAQYRLVFEYSGDGGMLEIKLFFCQKNDPAVSRVVLGRTELFRRKILALDDEFRLHDAFFDWEKIEISCVKSPGKIQIRNLRIVPVAEISGKTGPLVCPTGKKVQKSYGKNAVRVYFDLDNADLEQRFPFDGSLKSDFCPYQGFRDHILEGTEELIRRVDVPANADVIVYSRSMPGGSPGIVPALKRGARLLLYGIPADKFMEPYTALELKPFPVLSTAKRVTLEPGSSSMVFREKRPVYDYGRYYDIHLKKDATVLLSDHEGIPMAAQKGLTWQFTTGIGCALLENQGWYDRAFLRAVIGEDPEKLKRLDEIGVARAALRKRREEAITQRVAGRRWKEFQPGVSEGSFGRFGWSVAEGLQSGVILNDLTIQNGTEFFRFEQDKAPLNIAVNDWKARTKTGKLHTSFSAGQEAIPTRAWSGAGMVEWTGRVMINPSWKGKKLCFLVEKGIDDTDETYFNGRLIGKTDSSVSKYWKTERRYPIPTDAIRYGKENIIRVLHSNLRGDASFGSRPLIVLAKKKKRLTDELRVTDINWVYKEYEIFSGKNTTKIRLSLPSPFTQFVFDRSEVELSLEERTAQYAAWPTASGVKVVPLKGNFYDRKKDGSWSAPWLLLFRKNWENAHPLLLVFQHQVDKLYALRNGNYVRGIRIKSHMPLDTVAAGWPWGAKPVYTGKWAKGLPPETVLHLNRIMMTALNFPVGCDEAFRIDRKAKKIEVLNKLRFRFVKNDWNIMPRPWAVLPPLVAFASETKLGVELPQSVEDFGVFAMHGPLKGTWGNDTIGYTMPLYSKRGFVPVDVAADPEIHRNINEGVADGVRWSWGGHLRFDELTYAYPQAKRRKPWERNIEQFSWLYGLGNALQGYYGMSFENKRRVMNRISARVLMPYEQVQYKIQGRYREEPFSKIRYSTTMLSRRSLGTNFVPGFGAEFQFGDSNESCTLTVWVARQLGERMGYANWLRTNWNAIKQSMSFSWVINDWSHLAGSLNDEGVGVWGDMLNGEYAGMMAFARAAQIAGDKITEEQALYRAARRAIPTLARFRFIPYLKKTLPSSFRDKNMVCTGFSERKVHALTFPRKPDHNILVANELFDFPGECPGKRLNCIGLVFYRRCKHI